jgi:hypothetical protein
VEAYKILTLIGSILGLLITVGALGIVGLLTMGFQINANYQFFGIMIAAIIVYIIALSVTFAVKSTKAIGITLIVSAILILIFSSFYGILGFALLLAAGIIALRERKPLGSIGQISP